MKTELDSGLIGSLLGLFAHDLRNPLSALHSNVSFLTSVQGAVDPEAQEALEDVAASSDALGQITDNLELLSLALDGAKPRDPVDVPLREAVREAIQKSQRFAGSYRVALEIGKEAPATLKVAAHRDMLLRALGNLIRNGVQHAGEHGRVTLDVTRSGDEAIVTISDTGVPLSPDMAEQAFTAAGQLLAKNTAGGRYSRGLGLFAARIAASVAGVRVGPAAAPAHLELRAKAR